MTDYPYIALCSYFGGMNYLVKQISGPDTPRRKIGFGAKPGETSDTPYSLAK